LCVAAENGALAGGKVGGVADVVRDLPAALAAEGWSPTVVTPAYGILQNLPGAKRVTRVSVAFAGRLERVTVWQVPGQFQTVRNLVFDHALFSKGGAGVIYATDEPTRPFATDASKFAFFCAAVATWLIVADEQPDVVHLHDWHAAVFCLLQRFSIDHRQLRNVRTIFTIHNAAYQGTRPLRGDESSLEQWFPTLEYDPVAVRDPVHVDCINPMAMAIRLADMVSTVSPTYATEICRPSDTATAFVGGEGLETLLKSVANDGRLAGILNGCYYDSHATPQQAWPELLNAMVRQVSLWQTRDPDNPAHALAEVRLRSLSQRKPPQLLVSVGRLVAQKASLFVVPDTGGKTALQQIANELQTDGLLIILGSGDSDYEAAILAMASESDTLLFLNGYSESLANPLYKLGDLFLMPSSFEPCGISQLLAMREGLPCVVHGVGGLLDTVADGVTGFVFSGNSLAVQADGFIASTRRALKLRSDDPNKWREIRDNASRQRFDWSTAARATVRLLYEGKND